KAKSLGCFAGLSGEAVVGNAGEEACLSGFFRLYRCRLSGRVGDLEKAPGRSRES
ncbi:hypothetical protein HMPREF0322_04795, partial [Desulfitobacterium hafniense DP7]